MSKLFDILEDYAMFIIGCLIIASQFVLLGIAIHGAILVMNYDNEGIPFLIWVIGACSGFTILLSIAMIWYASHVDTIMDAADQTMRFWEQYADDLAKAVTTQTPFAVGPQKYPHKPDLEMIVLLSSEEAAALIKGQAKSEGIDITQVNPEVK